MSTALPGDVTWLLQAWSRGEDSALDKLVPLVYRELHLGTLWSGARPAATSSRSTMA
jgi:hypothetical protein